MCSKGDLSAFDLESESSVHHAIVSTKQYSKHCKQSQTMIEYPALTDQLHTNLPSNRQQSDENDATVTHCVSLLPPTIVPVDTRPQRQLASVENTHTTTSPGEQSGIRAHSACQNTPQCSETSPCTCGGLRKEVKCYATNTLPFASDEAQQDQSIVSKRRRALLAPIMASRTTGAGLKHTPRYGISELTCCGHRCMACDCIRQTSPPHHTLCYTDDSSAQSSSVSCDHRAVPLSKNPTIQSLPSPGSAAPSESAFPQDSARVIPRPLASASDPISNCSVFDTGSQSSYETKFPSGLSNTVSHDSSEVALNPLTDDIISSNEITSSSLPVALAVPGNTPGVRSCSQRRCLLRRKLRVKTFSHSRTACHPLQGWEREQHSAGTRGWRTGDNSETVPSGGSSVPVVSFMETPDIESGQNISGSDTTEGLIGVVGSGATSSCAPDRGERVVVTEQLVPEQTPHNTPPPNHVSTCICVRVTL